MLSRPFYFSRKNLRPVIVVKHVHSEYFVVIFVNPLVQGCSKGVTWLLNCDYAYKMEAIYIYTSESVGVDYLQYIN